MSYIRCLSNPEGLYIWGDVHGYCAITCNRSGHKMICIDQRDWDRLLKSWATYPRDLTIGCLHLTETPKYKIRLHGADVNGKKFSITMWEVTWSYIVNNRIRR
jgi:hypothetical protein